MKKYSYIIFVFISFCFCKKENKTAQPTSTNNTSGLLSGAFIHIRYVDNKVPLTTNTTVIQSTCFFFSPPIDPNMSFGLSYADVGSVSINSVTLNKSSSGPGTTSYFSPNSGTITLPMAFSISGSSDFPACNFVDNGSLFPDFSNMNQIPNSISKSAGFTFTLNNLVNTTVTEVFIGSVKEGFSGNVITFSSSQLSALSTSTNSNIRIECTLAGATFIGDNKSFTIANKLIYTKTGISIVP